MNAEFGGDGTTMEFHGALVNSKIPGDFLVEPATHNVLEHFKFARRELGERRAQRRPPGAFRSIAGITSESAIYGVDQLLLRGHFGEEIFRAFPHRSNGSWDIAMSAEEDDRQSVARLSQGFLQIEPAQTRHLQINQHTSWLIKFGLQQKFRR